MTNILDKLEALDKAAIKGPWSFARYYNVIENNENLRVALFAGLDGSYSTPEGKLIVEMRNNIGKLLAVAKAAKKFSEELRTGLEVNPYTQSELVAALAALEDTK